MSSHLWVVVPARERAEVIGATLHGLFAHLPNVVVVDDGSTDATAERARRAGAEVVRHAIRSGRNAALVTGIGFALARGAEFVCTFDVDARHDPRTIDALHARAREGDVDAVFASRLLARARDASGARATALRAASAFAGSFSALRRGDAPDDPLLVGANALRRLASRGLADARGANLRREIAHARLRYVEVPAVVARDRSSRRGRPRAAWSP